MFSFIKSDPHKNKKELYVQSTVSKNLYGLLELKGNQTNKQLWNAEERCVPLMHSVCTLINLLKHSKYLVRNK